MAIENNKTLIFLHLHRAGGTSIRVVLKRKYTPDVMYKLNEYSTRRDDSLEEFLKLSQSDRDVIKLLWGHMPYGLHKHFSQPCDYMTLLRHPVARIISEYNARLRNPDSYRDFKQVNLSSLWNFVNSDIDAVNDFQTRVLSGQCGWHQLPGTGVDSLTKYDFSKAKENLQNRFAIVGIAERMNEVVLVAKKELGLKNCYYFKPRRVLRPQHDIPFDEMQEIEKTIKEKNRFDLKLYEVADHMLDESITKHYRRYFRTHLFGMNQSMRS